MILDLVCILLSVLVRCISKLFKNNDISTNVFNIISERYLNKEPKPLDE